MSEPETIRRACVHDVAAIVALLAGDPISATREHPDELVRYREAFAAVDADPSELLVVAERDGEVVATMQLSFLPGLSRGAVTRLQVEGVHVAADHRGGGLGRRLLRWAEEEGRRRGCGLLQLTSDARRGDAQRFYRELGYEPSHVGFKHPL